MRLECLMTSEEILTFLENPGKIKAVIKPAWTWITGGTFGTIRFPIHAGTAWSVSRGMKAVRIAHVEDLFRMIAT